MAADRKETVRRTAAAVIQGVVSSVVPSAVSAGQADGTLARYRSGPMGDVQWTASRAKDK